MHSKLVFVLAVVGACVLGNASNAFADNNATGSTGAVQVGSVSAAPTASASSDGGSASVSAPLGTSGSGRARSMATISSR